MTIHLSLNFSNLNVKQEKCCQDQEYFSKYLWEMDSYGHYYELGSNILEANVLRGGDEMWDTPFLMHRIV